MSVLVFCFLIGAFIVPSESVRQYYFVIAPNVIRFNHEETVTVSLFGSDLNVAVTVWMEHRDKQISTKSVTVPDEKNPVKTTLRVTEADLFDSVIDEKPRHVRLCSRRGSESNICREVVLSYKTGYLIIQTDKPIYTPLQKVKIRVLALDESLKTIAGEKWQLSLDIVSPSNMTLGRRVFSRTKNSGFYGNVFKLPPYPEIGMWTARAFYMGQYETVSRALFQVDEYVLPTFGVSVHASKPYILQGSFINETITFTVTATYVYGKPVKGSVRISLNITDSMGDSQYLLDRDRKTLENGIGEFSVNVGDILASKTLKDKDLPDGSRLLAVATVFESATGKEEGSFHDEIVFATKPYIFRFTRSKRHFRPGMEYYVKVDMFTPNKQPASGETITVQKMDEFHQLLEEEEVTTDRTGQALAIFPAPNKKILKFKVIGPNSVQESDTLEVTAYDDKNQIQVEQIITDDNIMLMKAFSNVQLDTSGNTIAGYTGMLFVVVSRGNVVHTVFKPASNKVSEQIKEDLQELISPAARLLVFYVDEQTDKVVADSIKIEVDHKCRGDGLTLKPGRLEVKPGAKDTLDVAGSPHMWVGLNVMDKALLLLNDQNIMTGNKMFDVLKSHDLGCGEGSGKNNGDVFKNAGLTILTNAQIESDVQRISEECDTHVRKKRAVDDCYGANIRCCDYGTWYAKTVFYEKKTQKERAKLDSYTLCYSSARKLAVDKTRRYLTKCILAILYSCKEELDTMISGITQITSKSLNEISQYASDLERLAQDRIRPHKRIDFRESFLFDEVHLDKDGETKKTYNYPDSITEWMIQAIGITENKGICIANPVDVRVFRQFFIQLDLPYKATRLEMFDVKATVFNYGLEDTQVNMYLEGVEGLCYGNEPGQPSAKRYIDISPNNARTVKFPMIPLKAGRFPITVTAVVINVGIAQVDKIEKKLLVVNEGIQETFTIQVCLDPNQQREDCESHKRVETQYTLGTSSGIREQISTVDLTLPKIAIPNTGSATAYVQGNIMDNVVKIILSGVDSLFTCPHGCGEQTIATTAPNVYVMMYLKITKQVTTDIEVTGNNNIRDGVNREKTMFRHSDGSYSCCNNDKHTNTYRPTSVWLTAFVLKVFCHAYSVVDDVIDEEADLHQTINFLNNHINNRGEFVEIMDTRITGSWLKGATEKGSTPSLTSFVLISLLECNRLPKIINRTIDLAINYVENLDENWLKDRPFDLAISTYALALAKSNEAAKFKTWLHSIERRNGKNIYWGNSDSDPADAYSVETTAYALLAMLQFNDLHTSAYIVRWLTSQQDTHGVFRSTQDTVVGLQALSKYSIRTYSPEIDLQLSMYANGWRGHQMAVKTEKFKLQHIVDRLPVERGDNKMKIRVTGTSGSGRMRIELRYNRPAKDDEICPFQLSSIELSDVYKYPTDQNIASLRQCDVCGECAGDPDSVDYDTLTTPEPTPGNVSSSRFGRKKRRAGENIVDKMKCVRFSVSAKEGHQHGMSMIYFNLETDVTVLLEDMKQLMTENENLDDFEMPSNGRGLVVFYLNTMTSHINNFVFRLVDNFDGDVYSRQPVSVDVFDYYNPDQYCRKIYGTGPNTDTSVDYSCDSKKSQCKCLQSSCAKPVVKKLIKLARMMRNPQQRRTILPPALQLLQYTCNPEKANYAVYVEVKKVWPDIDTKNQMAMAVVVRGIHQGALKHEKDDELIFYWKYSCPHPTLEVGKKYYIIAKDGHKVDADNGQSEYQYPLMGSALVIQPPNMIRATLVNYVKLMKNERCKL